MSSPLTLETKVSKQGNDFRALFALGQLGEDQEPLVSPATPDPDTLQAHRQAVEKRLGHASSPDDLHGAKVFEPEVDKGKNDADGKDPFRDVERDNLRQRDLARPRIEDEKLVGGKCVDRVHGNREEEGKPEVDIGKGREAGSGLEVPETLRARLVATLEHHPSPSPYNVVPFLFWVNLDPFPTMAQ